MAHCHRRAASSHVEEVLRQGQAQLAAIQANQQRMQRALAAQKMTILQAQALLPEARRRLAPGAGPPATPPRAQEDAGVAAQLLREACAAPPDEQARLAQWFHDMLRDPALRPLCGHRPLATETVAALYDALQRHRSASGAFTAEYPRTT